jgi:esterase
MPLAHTKVTAAPDAQPSAWIYVLHGIYGSGRNWMSLARRIVEKRPSWGVVLVDLRLHGASSGFAPPHTLEASADDLVRLEEELDLPATVLLGHSFGGKVGLVRSAKRSAALRQVWLADSSLRTGEPSGTAWEVVGIVRSLPETFESRDQLADEMEKRGYDRGVGQWLAMNLERSAEGFRWKLDWDGVEEMLRNYFTVDPWPFIESPPGEVVVHVIRATRSSAIDDETEKRLEAVGQSGGRVHVHRVDAGHWLNVENPDAVMALLLEEIPG